MQKEINHYMEKVEIANCSKNDIEAILALYEEARSLQRSRQMVVWPGFSRQFIEAETEEKRQWKLMINKELACNWAITYNDSDIWEEKEKGDAVYIHRIATHPHFRGKGLVKQVVAWAIGHAKENRKKYVRLDTLGNNTKLIEHYTGSGFKFLGMVTLKNTQRLPDHYRKEPNCCLFEISIQPDKLAGAYIL